MSNKITPYTSKLNTLSDDLWFAMAFGKARGCVYKSHGVVFLESAKLGLAANEKSFLIFRLIFACAAPAKEMRAKLFREELDAYIIEEWSNFSKMDFHTFYGLLLTLLELLYFVTRKWIFQQIFEIMKRNTRLKPSKTRSIHILKRIKQFFSNWFSYFWQLVTYMLEFRNTPVDYLADSSTFDAKAYWHCSSKWHISLRTLYCKHLDLFICE